MKKILSLLLIAAFVMTFLVGCGRNGSSEAEGTDTTQGTNEDKVIAFSVKTLKEERWQNEVEDLQKYADEAGVKFTYQSADDDSDKQISQIENYIVQEVDVLIVAAVDCGAVSNVLDNAHENGIKIICYDDDLTDAWVDVTVGRDNYEVGKAISSIALEEARPGNYVFIYGDQASGNTVSLFANGMKDELAPLFEDGTATLVTEQYCINWAAENALAHVENALSKYNNDIAAVICMNDSTAEGAIEALSAQELNGKVIVTGMDGQLTALQQIVKGNLLSTVYKSTDDQTKAAMEVAVALAKGEEFEFDSTKNYGKNDVKFVAVGFDVITAENIDEIIIDKGVFTHEEVYGE